MKVAILKETYPGERRVALVPTSVPVLAKAGLEVVIESGAGQAAGFADAAYAEKGAQVVPDRAAARTAEILLQVRCLGANRDQGRADLPHLKAGQILIGMCDPLGTPQAVQELAQTGVTLFALELIPRITRAQSMDVLSSMATIAGYRAVLLAAAELPKMFPLLMTAAGTLTAARVLILGVGVAGLQAIATAKRLGAAVRAYDVRAATREQVESLGARFVDLQLDSGDAEDKGGYAKQLGEEFYQRQREQLAKVVAESDVVISTAFVPGKPAPLLITRAAVEAMGPGSVIVDLAAERGGNCEVTQPDQRVVHREALVLGPTNLPSEIPHPASLMFSNNVTKFLQNLVKGGQLNLQLQDEIIRETLVARDGDVPHPRLRGLLGLGAAAAVPAADAPAANPSA